MTSIAVMQPYFYPYTGYYQLMAAADVFVLFDCVQFNRRGWVHRNKFTLDSLETDWLTLPLQKGPQTTNIKDLVFDPGARHDQFLKNMARFPRLRHHAGHPLCRQLIQTTGTLVDYLENQLHQVANMLGLKTTFLRSSQLNLPPELKGQERILAICQRLGARRYVNASGGRDLYASAAFKEAGIPLHFLAPYQKAPISLLERLLQEPQAEIVADIQNFRLEPALQVA